MPHFDTYPTLYWFPVYALCWVLIWVATRHQINQRLFVALALLMLFLLRLPSIVFDYEINPDESQMITQALTLRHDPVYFRSVDGTTGGPLDSYFLILPSFLGLPFDYITAHLTAYALIAVCLWLLFKTAKLWFSEKAARLALLPFVFMLGLTQNGDFLHYNSELIALLLLSWSYYLYATQLTQRVPSLFRISLIGLLLGMVPFGKLQAVPLAAVVGLFVGIDVLIRRSLSIPAKIGRLAVLGAAGVAFPVLVIILTRLNGVYDDFITFYIVGNFRYAGNTNQWQSLMRLPDFFQKGSEFDWLVKFVALIGIGGLVMAFRRKVQLSINSIQIGGFVGLLLLATLFAITRTGSEYVHYLYFLTGPLLFILAFGWQQLPVVERTGLWVAMISTGVFLLLFGVQTGQRFLQKVPVNPYSSENQAGWAVQQSPVAKEVLKYARPGEKLAVWGWRCDYYIQTQMPQGVAENHTIRSAFNHPMLADYQKRYVSDFKRSVPPVFVDAVGSQNLWMNDRKTQGHELIKPLGQFVNAHYKYVGLVNDTRIYIRNDRIKGLSSDSQPESH
ncbi:hypothetical protein G8759_03000 [Spirosoma aureum]|uniref:Glycosyltransferase RgtA/B/C/D-like domain-containing protein n=1 Tax=Spirosoma aureum TaxID=2692134 RepID=A0A6G9AGS4_9BACT|nr:hypothetical protein [Spirosoma aureum]QIP11672.1 hypothetical protein G8759_03000 [Spirosoma aureum]